MPRLRVLCAIPNHPFQPGDVVDADQVDLPHGRVAAGWCEWVDGPPEAEQPAREPGPETATTGPGETASRRPRRPAAPRARAKAPAAKAPAAKAASKPGKAPAGETKKE